MIRVLRINSGGGYGGPERSIESYTRHGRSCGFIDDYYLLRFPEMTTHIRAVESAGGKVSVFGPPQDSKSDTPSTPDGRRVSRLQIMWRLMRRALPRAYVVRRNSMGWAAIGRAMIDDSLKKIEKPPDLCHIHVSHYFMCAGIYQACRRIWPHTPVVLHFHNGLVFSEPGICEVEMVAGADLCLFNSKYTENSWRRIATPKSSAIMPNPIEFPSRDVTARSLSDERIVLGTLGRLSPIKGVDVAIRAFAALVNVDSRLYLEVAGEGPEEAGLRALAHALGCSERVRFIGYSNMPYDLLSRWHVLLQPTKTIEAFGRTVVEAMACRCAVIASQVGGLPELIENCRTGYLVSPDDPVPLAGAMRLMLNDGAAYANIVNAGFKFAKRFEANVAVDALAAAYRSLLAS